MAQTYEDLLAVHPEWKDLIKKNPALETRTRNIVNALLKDGISPDFISLMPKFPRSGTQMWVPYDFSVRFQQPGHAQVYEVFTNPNTGKSSVDLVDRARDDTQWKNDGQSSLAIIGTMAGGAALSALLGGGAGGEGAGGDAGTVDSGNYSSGEEFTPSSGEASMYDDPDFQTTPTEQYNNTLINAPNLGNLSQYAPAAVSAATSQNNTQESDDILDTENAGDMGYGQAPQQGQNSGFTDWLAQQGQEIKDLWAGLSPGVQQFLGNASTAVAEGYMSWKGLEALRDAIDKGRTDIEGAQNYIKQAVDTGKANIEKYSPTGTYDKYVQAGEQGLSNYQDIAGKSPGAFEWDFNKDISGGWLDKAIADTRRSTESSAAARGMLNSGRTLQEISDRTFARNLLPSQQLSYNTQLGEYNTGVQDWQNRLNAQGTLANQGLLAAGGKADIGTRLANMDTAGIGGMVGTAGSLAELALGAGQATSNWWNQAGQNAGGTIQQATQPGAFEQFLSAYQKNPDAFNKMLQGLGGLS